MAPDEVSLGDAVEFCSNSQTTNGPVRGFICNKQGDLVAVRYGNTIEWFILEELEIQYYIRGENGKAKWGFV